MLYVVVIHPLVIHFSITHFIPSSRTSDQLTVCELLSGSFRVWIAYEQMYKEETTTTSDT